MKKIILLAATLAVCTSTMAKGSTPIVPQLTAAPRPPCMIRVSTLHFVDANKVSMIEIVDEEEDRKKPRNAVIRITVGTGSYYNGNSVTIAVAVGASPDPAAQRLADAINKCGGQI